MRSGILLIAAAALIGAAPATTADAQPAGRAAARDWSQVVTTTPEGGYRMGNPDAPVKVIEFLSLTCSHCASFAAEAMPQLVANHVRSGRVSLEYRNFTLNAIDVAASVLSRCAPPQHYFALTDTILSQQDRWMAPFDQLDQAEQRRLMARPTLANIQRIVAVTGLGGIAAVHGVTPQMAESCLADQARLAEVLALRDRDDRQYNVPGTPSFAINGRLVEGHSWDALEPLLRQP